jgi:hypothetical protein
MAVAWHRIFGMALTQYFAGTAWKVDVEVDLSMQQQRLDMVILRRTAQGAEPEWPDGFGEPAAFNLLTFKALQDPLDAWAIKELAAHSVNYRKQVSPHIDQLLPEAQFRLLAASMRFPRQLASRVVLQPQGPGAYDVIWGSDVVRILVLREIPASQRNLVWNLFSGDQERIKSAFQWLQPQSRTWSSIINDLLETYGLEGMAMPYTMEQFERDVEDRILRKMTPERLVERMTAEQRAELLERLTPEQRAELLERLTPEQRAELLQCLPPEQRVQGLSPEQVLAALPLDEIEKYLRKQRDLQNKPNG